MISVVDVLYKKGTLVPYLNNEISVNVKVGTLLGLCSGSPVNQGDTAADLMKAFNRKLLAIIQSKNQPVAIKIFLKTDDLRAIS